jgi:hypothetical protein
MQMTRKAEELAKRIAAERLQRIADERKRLKGEGQTKALEQSRRGQ